VKKHSANVRLSDRPFNPVELGRVAAGIKDAYDKSRLIIDLEPVDMDLVIAGMKDGLIKRRRHLADSEVVCILFSDGVWWSVP
jgi:hypothetical protein